MKKVKRTVGVPRQEKHLVKTLLVALRGSGRSPRRRTVCSELDCFQGVADVVCGVPNGHRLFPRDPSPEQLKLVSFSTAKVLSGLLGRRVSGVPEIAELTGLSKRTVQKQLSTLRELGVVGWSGKGKVRVAHTIKSPFKEITAIEVKVKDWRSGIYQARNYKSFANRVCVALPLHRAKLLRRKIGVFRRFRVGLLGVHADGRLVWLIRPPRQKPISAARNFLAAIRLLKQSGSAKFRA